MEIETIVYWTGWLALLVILLVVVFLIGVPPEVKDERRIEVSIDDFMVLTEDRDYRDPRQPSPYRFRNVDRTAKW